VPISDRSETAPLGFDGELSMIILVFGVSARSIIEASSQPVALIRIDKHALAARVIDHVLVGDPIGHRSQLSPGSTSAASVEDGVPADGDDDSLVE
jgi:hypothetical protein